MARKEKEEKLVSGYLAVGQKEYENRASILEETFRGQVNDKEIRFPKGLGAEHPFDFEDSEKITTNVGVINAAVDKIVDAIIGDFTITADNLNAQAILDDFKDKTSLKSKLRPWIKEAISKGNGTMEIDFDDEDIRVMNANYMYMRRSKTGKVLGWNQFKKKKSLFSRDSKDLIPFTEEQIAHLAINKIPNDPYGIGLVWPNRVAIENYAGSELDLYKLLSRKAGAPIHVKVGIPGESVQAGPIDDFKGALQYMNNSTEWVTDPNIEMKVIDFGAIGNNLTEAAMHALEQIAIGMKIPMSLLGVANIPEGLAKVNDNGFKRFISSIRTMAEEIIENKILQPILRKNNLKSKIEFEWELQDEEEKNERLKVINETMRIPFGLSPVLRAAIEREYSDLMGLGVDDLLVEPKDAEQKAEEDAQREREETEIQQPEVPGAKPTANQSAEIPIKEVGVQEAEAGKTDLVDNHIHTFGMDDSGNGQTLRTEPVSHEPAHTHKIVEFAPQEQDNHNHKLIRVQESHCEECNLTEEQLTNMTVAEYVNIKEIAGFNYTDYLIKILQALKVEKFNDLRAITESDLAEGLLPSQDIEKLRIVLKDGFRKNKTIREIEKDISRSIDLKDRVKLGEDGTRRVTLSSTKRPINIARTETVRLANQGLKNMYQENNINSYQYLAALDERTSEICMSLNGQVFLTKDGIPGVNMPPMHAMCRSSIVGLVN